MKKGTVLFIVCFPALLFAGKETVFARSDDRGENVEIVIKKNGIIVTCDLSGEGRLDAIGIVMENIVQKGDKANFIAHFSENKTTSVYFNYYDVAVKDYASSILYADKSDGKEIAGLVEKFAQALEKKYGLKKLAKETAKVRRKAFRKFVEEQKRLEEDAAAKRPRPQDIMKKIMDF
jgi:hypothetical protein